LIKPEAISTQQRLQLAHFGENLLQKLDLTQEQQNIVITELKILEKIVHISMAPSSASAYLKSMNKSKIELKVCLLSCLLACCFLFLF
jgi:hypothetical protein